MRGQTARNAAIRSCKDDARARTPTRSVGGAPGLAELYLTTMDAVESLTPGDAMFMVQGSAAAAAEGAGGARDVNAFGLSPGAARAWGGARVVVGLGMRFNLSVQAPRDSRNRRPLESAHAPHQEKQASSAATQPPGDGFVADPKTIAAAGLSDPRPFLGELLVRPYAGRTLLAPHVYPPSIASRRLPGGAPVPAGGAELRGKLAASWGRLARSGYCLGSKCRRFPVVIGAGAGRGRPAELGSTGGSSKAQRVTNRPALRCPAGSAGPGHRREGGRSNRRRAPCPASPPRSRFARRARQQARVCGGRGLLHRRGRLYGGAGRRRARHGAGRRLVLVVVQPQQQRWGWGGGRDPNTRRGGGRGARPAPKGPPPHPQCQSGRARAH
jgi:hypothetical protein